MYKEERKVSQSQLVYIAYVAVEVRNSTLCRNTSFENGACKVFVSIRLFAFSEVVFDYLQRVVQSKGYLLVFDRRQYHVPGPRYARSKM